MDVAEHDYDLDEAGSPDDENYGDAFHFHCHTCDFTMLGSWSDDDKIETAHMAWALARETFEEPKA